MCLRIAGALVGILALASLALPMLAHAQEQDASVLARLQKLIDKGNARYQAKDYEEAARHYEAAAALCDREEAKLPALVGIQTKRTARYNAEVRLYQLQVLKIDVIDMDALKAAGVVARIARKVKIINTGSLERAITVQGLAVTKGAQAAIEAAGGKVE